MNRYRIVKDSFSGYEAQVRYQWFPFMWFQVSDFFWINTFETMEEAIVFIKQKQTRNHTHRTHAEVTTTNEFEREAKLLFFKMKNFLPEVVWVEPKSATVPAGKRRLWPAWNSLSGQFQSKVPG